MTQVQKRRLGRGLAALIGEDTSEESVVEDARTLRHMPIELLRPNPHNPRKHFREEDLQDLGNSIRAKGLLQPLVVRPVGEGQYEIVAGERRWRAAQRVGVHDVPVLVRELSDGEALEVALIENIQRADLNPLEEASGYSQLIGQFAYTQQQLADSVGKSRSHIANTLRLLTLPEGVRLHIAEGRLTAGHARALVSSDAPADLADQIIKLGLSVRESEGLVREDGKPKRSKTAGERKDADTKAFEKYVTELTGLKVDITDRGRAGGQIVIRYKTLEQLDDVCQRLVKNAPPPADG